MNLKKWFFLFFTTLGIGVLVSLAFGLYIERDIWSLGVGKIFFALLKYTLAGMLFSLVSQLGFFAYLTIHRFGLGLFRRLWSAVQLLLIGFAFFDLIYLRYTAFGQGQSVIPFLILPVILLLFSIIIAYFKAKQTNARALIPSIFFLFIVTLVECYPALQVNNSLWLNTMLVALLICNTWQLMQLHRLTKQVKVVAKPIVQKKAGRKGPA